MSVRVMARVWEASKQELGGLLVMLAIADWANDDGYAWPSIARLAQKARLSERSVQYAIRKAVKDGELIVLRGKGPAKANLFQIPPDLGVRSGAEGRVQNLHPQGANFAPSRVQSTALKGANSAPNTSVNTHVIKTRQRLSRPSDDGRTAPTPEQNAVRKMAEQAFVRATGLSVPPQNTEKQRKAAGELWWAPLRRICELARWDGAVVVGLIEEVVKRMRREKLTISAPRSIVLVAEAVVGEIRSAKAQRARSDEDVS